VKTKSSRNLEPIILGGVRKRVQIAVAVLLTVVAGALAWRVLGIQEPHYQRRNLSSWLADLDPGNPHSSDKAMNAVRAIVTNSFPWLTKMFAPLIRLGNEL
jgi:hypothetical protein